MNYALSIIIPVYNVQPYIEACLWSVANQTMNEGVECILVDDCGTDDSMQVAETFVSNYQGDIVFSVLHHEHNRGLSAARNTGVMAAKGEYVYFLDSDDEITPNCMEVLWRLMEEHRDLDMVQGSYVAESAYMQMFEQPKFPEYSEDRQLIKRSLLDYNIIPVMAQNRLVRRALLLDNKIFFREGIIHEDDHWAFFLAKHVRTMAYSRQKTYIYRITPGSITNNINKEKEIHSYQTMIREFCANVDSEQRGAQRLCIYLLMDIMLRLKYYHSAEDRDGLFLQFYSVCNPVERLCLKKWYYVPVSSSQYNFWGRILQHLFKF